VKGQHAWRQAHLEERSYRRAKYDHYEWKGHRSERPNEVGMIGDLIESQRYSSRMRNPDKGSKYRIHDQ